MQHGEQRESGREKERESESESERKRESQRESERVRCDCVEEICVQFGSEGSDKKFFE